MEWIALIMPIAREIRTLIELYQRDTGRMPTPEELEQALRLRTQADTGWEQALNRLRGNP